MAGHSLVIHGKLEHSQEQGPKDRQNWEQKFPGDSPGLVVFAMTCSNKGEPHALKYCFTLKNEGQTPELPLNLA